MPPPLIVRSVVELPQAAKITPTMAKTGTERSIVVPLPMWALG
jgi:hypothetical protein